MDRRDFLKLFSVTAAGLYIPKVSYFFMPRRPKLVIIRNAIWVQKNENYGYWAEAPIGVDLQYVNSTIIAVDGVKYTIEGSKFYRFGNGNGP